MTKHVNIDDVGLCGPACPDYQDIHAPKNAPTSTGDYYLCQTHSQYYRAVRAPEPDPVTGEQPLIIQATETVPNAALEKLKL